MSRSVRRLRRKLVALAGAAALCMAVAVPGAALAGQGGDPNDGNDGHSKACEKIGKRHGDGARKANENRKAKMDKGHKCGLRGGPAPNGS
jgi:hypothetical protein